MRFFPSSGPLFFYSFFVHSLTVYLSGNHLKPLNHPPKALLNPTFLVSLQIQYCVPYLWSLWSVHIVGWTCGEAQTGGFDCTNPFKAGTDGIEAGYEKGWCSLPFLDPHLSPLLVSSNTPAIVADISKTALLWLRWHWGWKWLLYPTTAVHCLREWTEAGSTSWGLQLQPMTSCFFSGERFESGVKDIIKHLECSLYVLEYCKMLLL